MSGKKGMKKYPMGIREEVVARIRAGESQRALSKEKKRAAAELHLHSDQGFQYTSQAYFNLTQAYAVLRRLCQGEGTRMTMRWQKTFSPSSRQSAFTVTNLPRFLRQTR